MPTQLRWSDTTDDIDWDELSELYRLAPLGTKPADALRTVFDGSRYKVFAHDEAGALVGCGRVLADGLDVAYIADVAVHPSQQGLGVGRAIMERLIELSKHHAKIILYANHGTEPFYRKLGFLPMTTAMAIWQDRDQGVRTGFIREDD